MTHTFFQSNTYTTLSNTDVGDKSQFICECSYAPDTTQLDLVFDPSESYYQELTDKLDSGTWSISLLGFRSNTTTWLWQNDT